ncbi:MAG TPA: hypothetical protein ENN29_14000, partial [Candidatus Hydrogenedentes bacterium]|nr:hypothetical protein [Candidatus Hydrogenedentota bacterium]
MQVMGYFVLLTANELYARFNRRRTTIMGKRGCKKQTRQWRAATACALLFLAAFPTFTAGAKPPPTRPYTVTRWVDEWAYNAGEILDITLRIGYNNIEVSDALYLQKNEMYFPSAENWEYLSLVDADGR